MHSGNIQIRPAKREELPQILSLVKELAAFEREPEAVTARLEDYQKAFDTGLISSDVAIIDSELVGMTLYYDTFSTWKGPMLYLEDFYVKPEFRSKGIGSKLWASLIEEAKSRNCVLIKWQVLDWNKDAIRFYKSQNADIDSDWYNGRLWLR